MSSSHGSRVAVLGLAVAGATLMVAPAAHAQQSARLDGPTIVAIFDAAHMAAAQNLLDRAK